MGRFSTVVAAGESGSGVTYIAGRGDTASGIGNSLSRFTSTYRTGYETSGGFTGL